MAEELNCIERIYTYTYDQFMVFFYGSHVFIGGKEYPIGQCCSSRTGETERCLGRCVFFAGLPGFENG